MTGAAGSRWWSSAWDEALDGIAASRGNRLSRGRRLARVHAPADLTVSGRGAGATVRDGTDTYEAHVALRNLREDEWDAVLGAVAAQAGHTAALLDGELPPEVVEDALAVEVDLLPRARDLRTACTCPDEIEPCVHAVAVCHLVGLAIAADPFVLFLLRGRSRTEVLDGLRARRLADASPPDGSEEPVTGVDAGDDPDRATATGVTAAEAWSRRPGPLPSVPITLEVPGRPATWPTEPPTYAPFSGAGLRRLAQDAIDRAWAIGAGASDTALDLDERTDLARLAAAADDQVLRQLASRAGLAEVELRSLAEAWRWAGRDGVGETDAARWDAPESEMASARRQVVEVGHVDRRVHVSGNRVTAEGRIQFRLGRDGRWYRFSKEFGAWALSAPPEEQLSDLLDVT